MIVQFLLYPQVRINIKGAFACLANYDWQMKEWVEERSPNQYWNCLVYHVINTLYDTCDLDKYRENNIGKILYDEDEAQQIYKFCKWFGDLIDSISLNTDETNADYLDHPEWPKVYIGAKELYELMDRNDKKYHFSEIADG